MNTADMLPAPRTILCGRYARFDVQRELAGDGICAGTTVIPVEAYIKKQAEDLAPRKLLDAKYIFIRVSQILSSDSQATALHQAGIAHQAATRTAVAQAVERLLRLPKQWRHEHGGRPLPQAVAEIADQIESDTAETHFTWAQAAAHAAELASQSRIDTRRLIPTDESEAIFLSHFGVADPADETVRQPIDRSTGISGNPGVVYYKATSPTDEVQRTVASIRESICNGVSAESIAVAYGDAAYRPIIRDRFARAKIPFTLTDADSWLDNPYIATLLELLSINPQRLHRRELANVINANHLKRFQPQSFDLLTRGGEHIINVDADWHLLSTSTRKGADELHNKVMSLRQELLDIAQAQNWPTAIDGVATLAQEYLLARDDSDFVAAKRVTDALRRLHSGIANFSSKPDPEQLVHMLSIELAGPTPTEDKGGIIVGPIETLAGRKTQTTFILGATEDALPRRHIVDPCITDAQYHYDAERDNRRALARFHSAILSGEETIISYPASTPRSAACHPSPWLSELAATRLDDYNHSTDIKNQGNRYIPTSEHDEEFARSVLGVSKEQNRRLAIHQARLRGDTEGDMAAYVGFPNTNAGESYLRTKTLSASALENYLKNPQAFYLQRVLGHRLLEDPDPAHVLPANTSGTLYHNIIETWTNEHWFGTEHTPDKYSPEDWDKAAERLKQIASEKFATISTGQLSQLTKGRVLTQVMENLDAWLHHEHQQTKCGWVALGAEVPFGKVSDDTPEFTLPVDTGKGTIDVHFRGFIDRVDYHPESNQIRLTDYKTGKDSYYNSLPKTCGDVNQRKGITPIGSDEKPHLQLALYGEVARRAIAQLDSSGRITDPGNVSILTRYWFICQPKTSDDINVREVRYDEEAHSLFTSALNTIGRNIVAGIFPPSYQAHRVTDKPYAETMRLGAGLVKHYAAASEVNGTYPIKIITAQ